MFGIISGSWCIGMYALWKGVAVSMKDRDNGTVEFRERLQPHEVLSLVGIGVGLGKRLSDYSYDLLVPIKLIELLSNFFRRHPCLTAMGLSGSSPIRSWIGTNLCEAQPQQERDCEFRGDVAGSWAVDTFQTTEDACCTILATTQVCN